MSEERRLTEDLLEFWEGLKQEGSLVLEADIDPDKLAAIWGECFLVRLIDREGVKKYRYEYLGEKLIEAYGDDFSSEEADSLLTASSHRVAQHFDDVIEGLNPIYDDDEFDNSKHMRIKYRQLLLPCSSDGASVDMILDGMRWVAV